MAVESSTVEPVEAAAPEATTAEAETPKTADTESEDTSQTSDSGGDVTEVTKTTESGPEEAQAETDNSEEAEIKEWAAKKNLPLDDPIKIAKMYRESEKALGAKGQKEGQLKAAVTEANSSNGTDEVDALRNEVAALGFYITHPEAKQYEAEMVKILDEKPYLAGDLETVLDAAKGRSTTEAETLAAERKAGKAEALAMAEKAGRAAPPKASATNTDYEGGKITPQNVDALIGQHMGDRQWWNDHKAEIDAALAA